MVDSNFRVPCCVWVLAYASIAAQIGSLGWVCFSVGVRIFLSVSCLNIVTYVNISPCKLGLFFQISLQMIELFWVDGR
jgi:hypothetical protein